METEQKIKFIQDLRKAITAVGRLTVEDIRTVYTGRQGCACGCGGDYKETPRAKKLAITNLKKKFAKIEEQVALNGVSNLLKIECGEAWFDNDGKFRDHIVSWEGEERAYRIYAKEVFGDIK